MKKTILLFFLLGLQFIVSSVFGDPILYDDFEDGVIDTGLWVVGGAKRGWSESQGTGIGNWSYSWEEIIDLSDGYLSGRVWGPTSGNTYGAEAWVRTVYNFNDGKSYLVNFTWEAEIGIGQHYDYYYIQITDGYIPELGSVHWPMNQHPTGTVDLLCHDDGSGNMLPGQSLTSGMPKTTWSIEIEPDGTARLYDGPDATGTLLHEASLDTNDEWYVRLMVIDATSSGFPAGDDRLNLYEFTASEIVSEPATYYVDDDAAGDPCHGNPDYSDPLEDGSPEHPFDAIQEAIDVAVEGGTVIVLTGTFTGDGNRDIDYGGKAITVRSLNGPETCIIDCQGSAAEPHRGFYFHSSEDANSILDGFTITGGNTEYGGGVYCDGVATKITNCLIYGNSADYGGGIYRKNTVSEVSNCIIRNNDALEGGGVYSYGDPYFIQGYITITVEAYGHIFTYLIPVFGSGKFANCEIKDNSADKGGGIYYEDSVSEISDCIIVNNNADYGGGLYCCNANTSIINDTISQNSATNTGGGVYCTDPNSTVIRNSILWNNEAIDGNEIALADAPIMDVNYSDVEGGASGVYVEPNSTLNWGEGNIDADPCFVGLIKIYREPRREGRGRGRREWTYVIDYHLRPDSPCIDAGDPNYVPGPNETDLDGNPRVVNGRIDMGAYEYQGLPDLLVTSEDITFVPVPGEPCQPVTISATIHNVGLIPTEDVNVVFKDCDDVIGSQIISSILPGDSNTVSVEYTWPEASFRLITVTVDPNDKIVELDETNNSASKVYQIDNPTDANAILDVSWNSAPACYTEGTTAIIQGKADYRIEITGADDIVSPALGSIVTAQIIDSNEVVTNLQSTLTGPDGYFYIPFSVPGQAGDSFTIEISVTDGTLTGIWEKIFCVQPYIQTPDLWIGELTFNDQTPDLTDTVTICATVYARADNNETVLNIPVTFYAYPPTGGVYQIDSNTIDQMAPGDSNSVCVDWTPTVNGLHRIKAILGPGFSDDNNGNNYKYSNIIVGMFNVTASPRWAVTGQQVQITVDSREPLLSDQLDSITVLDSVSQPIPFSPAEPCHPSPTRWVYQTDPLPAGTALGTATITVTGTDASSVQHTTQGYFEVYETMPDFWLHSCDISFSDLNPALGEPITIDAVVHADSSNPESIPDIPVTFYSKHLPSNGDYIKISQTQYTGEILPSGVSTPVSVPWQNAAKGEYIMKVQLGPDFSDRNNGNNAATRAILVGEDLPFDVVFKVVSKTRIDRTVFDYECNVIMTNLTGLTLENVQLELLEVSGNMNLPDPPCIFSFAYVGPEESVTSEDTCIIRVDRSVPIEPAEIHWHLTYQIVDICGVMQQTFSSVVFLEPRKIAGDISSDGEVNFEDLAELADQWLGPPGTPSADIAPQPNGDGIVNFLDFAELAENWQGF